MKSSMSKTAILYCCNGRMPPKSERERGQCSVVCPGGLSTVSARIGSWRHFQCSTYASRWCTSICAALRYYLRASPLMLSPGFYGSAFHDQKNISMSLENSASRPRVCSGQTRPPVVHMCNLYSMTKGPACELAKSAARSFAGHR
jgi:hypothetical protein